MFRSDNRSSFDSLAMVLQGNVTQRFNLIAHYTLASAKTWGCVLGELFDYVNGVCDPLNPFGPAITARQAKTSTPLCSGGNVPCSGRLEFRPLTQAESARPFTLTTPAGDRAVVNGVKTSLDQVRGTPYIQIDLRVNRPIKIGERVTVTPFAEFFNLFNRNNPGANYVTDISALPIPVNNLRNATALCPDPRCSVPITSLKQLLVPAGGLGDFFGPGTTVGIPFAAQFGVRVNF